MLLNRLTTAIVLIGASICVIFFDVASGVVITGLIAGCLYEFFVMLEKKGINVYKYFGMAVGVIIPLTITFRFELTKGWELFFVVFAFIALLLMQFKRRTNTGAITDIATTMFAILYISWFLSFLIKLRYLPNGLGLLGTLLLVAKSGDIGAYLVGVRFGKRPLMPRISPKKSVEGGLGGLLFSVLTALACKSLLDLSSLHMAIVGLAIGVLAQLGDLSESLVKRDCQVKDSGALFPGMGGFLDIMDSLLFTAPAFYFYICYVNIRF
jgi:phosphatidate cytidylyltransferase